MGHIGWGHVCPPRALWHVGAWDGFKLPNGCERSTLRSEFLLHGLKRMLSAGFEIDDDVPAFSVEELPSRGLLGKLSYDNSMIMI